jgi:hypothetical protein
MTAPSYVYDNIVLNELDYKFFQSLPVKEKLIFLYDLCLEVENHDEELEDEYEDTEEEDGKLLPNKLLKFFEQASCDQNYVHILILPDILVISGNLTTTLSSTKNYLFNEGYIFTSDTDSYQLLNNEVKQLQTYFKYVEVYKLLSIIYPTSLN